MEALVKTCTVFCLLLVVVGTGASCAARQPPLIGMNAPDPNGCYVQVYEGDRFIGASDFINGPRRYATLGGLPNGANWSNRIRSVKVGPAATITVWTDAEFQGRSLHMAVDRAFSALIEGFVASIESMDVQCIAPPTVAAARGALPGEPLHQRGP